jgi:hypothetical protein
VVVKLDKKFDSEFDVYYTLISMYNVIEKWGLTETQIKILIYLIRFGYSKKTKEIICEKLNISDSSLTTNLSYLRQGKIGKKKIKKLLETSQNNMNITLLKTELNDIKKFIDSKDKFKAFYIRFDEDDDTQKITDSNRKRTTSGSVSRTGN